MWNALKEKFHSLSFPLNTIFFYKVKGFTSSRNLKTNNSKAVIRRCSVKKVFLDYFAKFTGKHLCQRLFFNIVAGGACNFIKKEKTLAQVFPCEFCEIFKNTFFTEHIWGTASWICGGVFFNITWKKHELTWKKLYYFKNLCVLKT